MTVKEWPLLQQDELAEIVNAAYNGIVTVNREGKVVLINKAAEKILSIKRDEILGLPISQIIPNSGLPDVLRTGRPESAKIVKVGNVTVISNRSPIIREGKIVGAVGVFQDVSELYTLRRELQKEKDLNTELEAIIESSFDGIGIIDADGTLLRVNKAYRQISGLTLEDSGVGQNIRELEKKRHVYPAVGLMVFQEKKPVTIKQKIKTGKEVLITGNPVFDENGNVLKVICNIRDMTELNNLKAQAEDYRSFKERFCSELQDLRARQLAHDHIVAQSPEMHKVLELAQRVALVDSNVLITGETGVGKEIIAKIIHKTSFRTDGPFIKINCGAIPENLLESELFGYMDGAFTGARRGGKVGIFEYCNKGSVLLDEIGEMPLGLQVKLLRVIQEQEIFRIGDASPRKIDVRIIASTNKDLKKLVEAQQFRADLFYRLNVVSIEVPPLRERREDIMPLAIYFLEKFNSRYQKNRRLEPEAYHVLESYTWPGNVRELENLIERLVVVVREDVVSFREVTKLMEKEDVATGEKLLLRINDLLPLQEAREMLEKKLLRRALQQCGSTRKVARALGVTHPTILNKMHKYGLVSGRTDQDAGNRE
ncbi:MAG: sigma 54-interacting transcriptional regulator [Bacillota bacterium]